MDEGVVFGFLDAFDGAAFAAVDEALEDRADLVLVGDGHQVAHEEDLHARHDVLVDLVLGLSPVHLLYFLNGNGIRSGSYLLLVGQKGEELSLPPNSLLLQLT